MLNQMSPTLKQQAACVTRHLATLPGSIYVGDEQDFDVDLKVTTREVFPLGRYREEQRQPRTSG